MFSNAIAMYLCSAYGATSKNRKLYPNDLKVRTRVDEVIFLNADTRKNFVAYAVRAKPSATFTAMLLIK